MKDNNAFYHFSVDDVFDSLIEVTDREIDLFEHPFFSFLKELNDKFKINVDLYLFFQKKINGKLRTLKDVSNSIKQELNNNSWIRLGPHSLDDETAPYSQTPEEQRIIFNKIYNEIFRFSGKKNLSKWVRLHYFSESYELKEYFNKLGVEAIFTTDKDRITTRMPEIVNESLKTTGFGEYNGLKLIRSNFRIEDLANEDIGEKKIVQLIDNYINKYNHLCFFTHEYELVNEMVRLTTIELIKNLYNKKIQVIN